MRRPVLAPFGLPEDERLCAAISEFDGDLRRTIDQPRSPEGFADHVARLRFLRAGPMPIVVLARPDLPFILEMRRLLERAIPRLIAADWLVPVQGDMNPFAFDASVRIGSLSAALEEVPLWLVPGTGPFVVLSNAAPIAQVHARRAELEARSRRSTRRPAARSLHE